MKEINLSKLKLYREPLKAEVKRVIPKLSFPIGSVIAEEEFICRWPEGRWVRCDGRALSIEDFPELFDIIGRVHTNPYYCPSMLHFCLPNTGTMHSMRVK